MRVLRCAVAGETDLALRCVRELEELGHSIAVVVTRDPSLTALCDDALIDTIERSENLSRYAFDYLIDVESRESTAHPSYPIVAPYLNRREQGAAHLYWLAHTRDRKVVLSKAPVEWDASGRLRHVADELAFETFTDAMLLLSRSEPDEDSRHPAFPANLYVPECNLFSRQWRTKAPALDDRLIRWNQTRADFPKEKTLVALFEATVARVPDKDAVVFDGHAISYDELNQWANAIAAFVRARYQALYHRPLGADTVIALCMGRSIDMIAGALGILKAGAAYLPLDPAYPAERVSLMLEDAHAVLMVTHQRDETRALQDAGVMRPDKLVCVDQLHPQRLASNPTSVNEVSDLAYVMYTSGSTGKPKGVMVEHQHVVASTFARFHAYEALPERFLLLSSIAFDSSVAGIYWTLLSGCTLVIPKQEANDVPAIAALIRQHKITHLLCIPSLYQMLLKEDVDTLASLKTVIVAGESCQLSVVNAHFEQHPDCALVNEYGPTEATVWSSYSYLEPNKTLIGKPIANTQLYILDEALQPVPWGQRGELYIAGAGIARGYFGNNALTRERFLENPFGTGRLYKTGDLARLLDSGEIEYLGRIDSQVKIRGFRIELGEIEAKLNQHEDLDEAAVIAYGPVPGQQQLVAYCVPGMFTPSATELKHFLARSLPDHMVPQHFLFLDGLPRLDNGKLNRQGLPAPDLGRQPADGQAPHSLLESKLSAIWCQVLGLEQVGVRDNFLQLGGHSLLAVRLIQIVNKEFRAGLTVRDLLSHPCIEALAQCIEAREGIEEKWPEIVADAARRNQPFPLTAVQSAYWMGRQDTFELGQVATHVYSEQAYAHLDIERLEQTLNVLISRHEMLRMVVLPSGQQQILELVPHYRICLQDLTDAADPEQQLSAWRAALSHQVLDTSQWPLFDFRVSRLSDRYHLHLSIDALLLDALSVQIFLDEWATLYRDMAAPLPLLDLSFRDYMTCFQKLKQSAAYASDRAYWLSRIDGLPMGPELPLATLPARLAKPRFKRCTATIEKARWTQIKEFAQVHKVTPTSVLLAAYAAVLARWSKNPHFLVNLTIFNRFPLHPGVDRIMGDFTSLELLEIGKSGPSRNFVRLVEQVQEQLWQDLEHRLMDGVEVQRELVKNRGFEIIGRVAPVVFTSLLNQPTEHAKPLAFMIEGFIEEVYSISQTPQVWLDNKAYEDQGGIVAEWDYVDGLFPDGMIQDMHDAYCQLLDALAEGQWSKALPQLLPDDQVALIAEANQTAQGPIATLLHAPFLQWAELRPERPAVITEQRQVTYGELADIALKIAAELLRKGVKPNQLVAVVMEKGWQQPAACLGILASGAAYLPVHAAWPAARIKEVLEQGEVEVILTQTACLERLAREGISSRFEILDVDRAPTLSTPVAPLLPARTSVDDIAYVIFTSGTTGQPKGVVITHRNATNTIEAVNQRFDVSEQDRILGLSDLSFDLSVYDIFGVLSRGAALVLPAPDRQKDPEHWLGLIGRHGVSLWNTVPTLTQMLIEQVRLLGGDPETLSALRVIMMSGDWIPLSLPQEIRRYCPKAEIMSLGGATEGSIWSIWYKIDAIEPTWQSIPYGKAMPNQHMYVLDQALELRPVHVTGDIYIGGMGVAKGYWRDPVRTQERFKDHPITGEQIYKTGDLGFLGPDGNITILGRDDTQVKVGGHRIELGEIEHALRAQPEVSDAIIVAVGDAKKRLVAFFIPTEAAQGVLFSRQRGHDDPARWSQLCHRAEQRSADIPRSAELAQTLALLEALDQAAPMLMLFSLNRLGLFRQVGQDHTIDEALSSVSKAYDKLFRQWLETLAESGWLIRHDDRFSCRQAVDPDQYRAFWQTLRQAYRTDLPILFDYFERCQAQQPALFQGQVNALDLFMPDGSTAVMEDLYQTSVLARYYNGVVEAVLESLVAHHPEAMPLRILEVGAGIGGTTAGVLPLLPAGMTHYTFTDLSSFFLNHAKQKFSGYDFISYGLLDINTSFQFQGYERHGYDIILAANVVHGAKDIRQALAHLHDALAPGGVLVLVEGTDNSRLQMLNIGFIEGLSEYEDDRRQVNRPLVTAARWAHDLRLTGFRDVAIFAGDIGATGFAQQHVIVAQAADTATVLNKVVLKQRLARLLPDYMVPDQFVALDQFPLSPNGKVDRRQLLRHQTCSPRQQPYVVPAGGVEMALAKVWSQVLGVERIGAEDNFFELGGDSILSIQVAAKARQQGLFFAPRHLFECPTLTELALKVSLEDTRETPAEPADGEVSNDDVAAIMSALGRSHG